MHLPKGVLSLGVYLGGLACVWANTEIVNFDASRLSPDGPLPQTLTWPKLSPESHERVFSVLPAPLDTPKTILCEPVTAASLGACPHELWLSLGTHEPEWTSYSRFTLRVSWPASSPADFFLDIFSADSLRTFFLLADRRQSQPTTAPSTGPVPMFARIRLVHAAVLVPSPHRANVTLEPVQFMVTVEPLYLGAIPISLFPTILLLVAVTAVGGIFVAPPITAYLSAIADRIRTEQMAVREEQKQKSE